jgi:Flp pilus assembly pilin Flp
VALVPDGGAARAVIYPALRINDYLTATRWLPTPEDAEMVAKLACLFRDENGARAIEYSLALALALALIAFAVSAIEALQFAGTQLR